jgi:hypothetical protein
MWLLKAKALMKNNLFILILPFFLSGCLHTVGYKLTDSDRWTGPKIDGVVCVKPIADQTVFDISDWRPEHSNQKIWRTNYRGGYSDTNLTSEVTAMIIKQLAYSGLFTKVVSGSETNVDYVLSGTLVDFKVRGQVNTKAENIQAVSAGFGLIGALVGSAATAKMTSEIQTSVKLDNLKLTDKASQTLWYDTIGINTNMTVDFEEADPNLIFNFPDLILKDTVNEMIHRLGNSSLTNHVHAKVN